jgi:hypothetical protein
MNNNTPSTLKEIIAFTNIAYVIVETMQLKGKLVKFNLHYSEMRIWRRVLESERDRQIFDKLGQLLWPDLNELPPTEWETSCSSHREPRYTCLDDENEML